VTAVFASALSDGLERGGLIADALAVGALLALAVPLRARKALVVTVLVLTPVVLALVLWNNPKLAALHHHPLRGVVAILAVVVVVAALAHVIDRHPLWLAPLALVALPFRVPLGSVSDGLLLPLYAVVAAGCLVFLVRGGAARPPELVGRLLALALVVYAAQAAYTPASGLPVSGLTKAVENAGFFYVPFALLYLQLREVEWTGELLRRALWIVAGLGVLFALVGLGELAAGHHLLVNRSLDEDAYFIRINSLFYDPNIFGRFLALAMVLLATALLREHRPRVIAAGSAAIALMWGGLLLSLSESSIVALLAGLAVAGILLAGRRLRALGAALALAAVVIALAYAFAAGSIPKSLGGSSGSLGEATSGRTSLVSGGFDLFKARPLDGYGSGSFATEYLASIPHVPNGFEHHEGLPYEAPVTSDSHTTPVTIAAEQGVIGLLAYAALLVACFVRLLGAPDLRRSVARVAIAAAFTALVVHTLFYADFLEDPSTWVLLAVGGALAAMPAAPA
jgi:putative inorganic carbon (HCO3(-)) transporter